MISFDRVSKRYASGREALTNVSFNIHNGEMVFLTGRSGAGKSTVLKLIALLERPTRGSVVVHGRNTRTLKGRHIAAFRRRIGVVFQDHRLLADRPVFDNVALPLAVAATPLKEIDKRVRAALDQVGLLGMERALPLELSVGEQQRVGLARAVVSKPPLLIADEPTGNLDPELSLEVMRLFRRFQDVGVTVVVATHDLHLVREFGQRVIVLNAQLATGNFANAVDVSVYLKTDVPLAKAQQLAQAAGQRAEVAAVTVIAADKGLQDFRTYSGFGEALQALKENPLPHVLHVRPKAEDSSAAALESLRRYFSAWPEVDLVQVDSEWVMRFNAILEVLRWLLLIAAVLLGLGVLAVIGNTIRLEIQGRRAEIEVTKLVGGSNSFVRRPFLYTGVLYGLGGALLAWGIVAIAVAVLGDPVATLARLYGSRYVLRGPSRDDIGILLGAGAALGWLGAWISAARHLRSIEPRA